MVLDFNPGNISLLGLWFKQSSLIACNQQPSKGAAAASSSHYKLEIKIAL